MQCSNPRNYNANGVFTPHIPPCGKCLSCLATNRHQWASRLLLERKSGSDATFFTLTFSPEHLPDSPDQLKPIFQKFIKRINKHEGSQPRYFTCLEYGSRYGRPHFHGIFFNRPVTFAQRRTSEGKRYHTDPSIEDRWDHGSTYSKDCPSSGQGMNIMRYIANYILKNKWQRSDSTMPPEWALMSRTPYIGQPSVKHLCDALNTSQGQRHCGIIGTVPDKFKMAGKTWKIPLRIRREVAAHFDYPVLTIPYNDGTIIKLDNGLEVLREKIRPPIHFREAQVLETKLSRKIKTLRKSNIAQETG